MPAPKGHAPYNVNGEGGRPKIYTEEKIEQEAHAFEEWLKEKDNIFVELFCFERGYHESRFYEFIEVNKRFSDSHKLLQTKQKGMLFKGGLTRKYAHPMCALILSSNHQVYLKSEQKLTGTAIDALAQVIDHVNGNSKDLVNDKSN